MSTTFHLARHGEHDQVDRTLCGRMPGVTLNARGREQARAAGRRLASLQPLAHSDEPAASAREQTAEHYRGGDRLPDREC